MSKQVLVSSGDYYREYHGHTTAHLQTVFDNLSQQIQQRRGPNTGPHSFVWLVGDSTVDSKHWEPKAENAVNGMEQFLSPPKSVVDPCHVLNKIFADHNERVGPAGGRTYTCINCAVEKSTVGERTDGKMFPQDEFVRDHCGPEDIIFTSLGGNDVALKPSVATIAAMGWLAKCSRTANVKDGSAWGLGQFHGLFHDHYTAFLHNLTAKVKPRLIVPCMLYYLDENAKAPAWAGRTLNAIGYNTNPGHVQAILDRIFIDSFVNKPHIVPGVKRIFPIELKRALDGKTSSDYVQRVEPSAQGCEKMGALMATTAFEQMDLLDRDASAVQADAAVAAAVEYNSDD
jgi:hypothetical protein